MSLEQMLKGRAIPKPRTKRTGPLWKGPEQDGITFSMLTRFLSCRERFRLYAIEGLRPVEQFNHRIEYGQMWHVCEEAVARDPLPPDHMGSPWFQALMVYCKELCRKFPLSQDQVDHWYNVCKVQFPLYVDYWSQHPDVINRVPLLQEQVFDVPYKLPSGRIVRLRGKWDSVDLVEE